MAWLWRLELRERRRCLPVVLSRTREPERRDLSIWWKIRVKRCRREAARRHCWRQLVVGLDIGTSKIVAIVAEVTADGGSTSSASARSPRAG